ncbi:MAG: YkgJ family cysteine cluster protein [Spirochaetales bacterium]|nr:YkgJ family cysteine cluster protein [Spirochaetales bacterium]
MSVPFYAGGLRFSCQRCSRCCRLEPGFVFLSERDVDVFCEGLGMARDVFEQTYCREVPINGNLRLSLKEKPNLDCIFWEAAGCSAYSYRPLQCRSYPFWHSALMSPHSWDALKASCPGVGKGVLHSGEEIELWLHKREEELLINRKVD